MKKIVSIVLAMLMVCAMAVTVCAEEVLYSEDIPFWDAGNWSETDLTDADGNFFELLNNENAYLVITRSVETHIEFSDSAWEKFCLLDSWWSAKICPTQPTLSASGFSLVLPDTPPQTKLPSL